jgi:hypothetical protein
MDIYLKDLLNNKSKLKKIENQLINDTKYKQNIGKYKKYMPKKAHCILTKKYIWTSITSLNDILRECLILGHIRYDHIESDYRIDNYLKKNIPYSTKLKLLNIVRNIYILPKLNIYEIFIDSLDKYMISYKKNIIYIFLLLYIVNYFKNQNNYYRLNTILRRDSYYNSLLFDWYVVIDLNLKIEHTCLKTYVNNTKIKEIILDKENKYSNNEIKYRDYIYEYRKYDNFKLYNKYIIKLKKEAIDFIVQLLYSDNFKRFVYKYNTNIVKYEFDDKIYTNICKKSGILKEYIKMKKEVDEL